MATSCPNCEKDVSPNAIECEHCNANFSDADDWKPKAKQGTRKPRITGSDAAMQVIFRFLFGALGWFAYTEQVKVSNHFSDEMATLEQIQFIDGTTWQKSVLDAAPYLGTAGSDTLFGTIQSETFIAGKGADVLNGMQGSDTYVWQKGDGNDIIIEMDDWDSAFKDTLKLLDVKASEVVLNRDQTSLYVTIGAEQIKISNHFSSPYSTLEQIQFSDGTTWERSVLDATPYLGTASEDTLNGTNQSENFQAGKGADTISGYAGNDLYTWAKGDGNDVITDYDLWQEGNIDTLRLTDVARDGVQLSRDATNLYITVTATGEKIQVSNHFSNFAYNLERIEFSSGNPLLLADLNAAPFRGTAGADTITGTGGSDLFIGGKGADMISGYAGNDLYTWAKGDGNDVITDYDLWQEGNIDTLRLTDVARDGVQLSRDATNLYVTVIATGENIQISNQFSNFAYNLERIEFASGNTLTGNSGNNRLVGGFGADTLMGGDGDDVLDGPGMTAGGSATVSVMVTSDTSAQYSVDGTTSSSVTLANGILPSVAAGQSLVFQGGGGDSTKIYVTPGSRVDLGNATMYSGGLYLSGQFADYSQSLDQNTGVYTFSRNLPGGQSESAAVKVSDRGNPRLYFADGSIALNSNAETRLASVNTQVDNHWDFYWDPYAETYVQNYVQTYTDIRTYQPIQQNWLTGGTQAWPADIPLVSQGADRLVGGLGNDSYFVDDAGDVVVENIGEGTDIVKASVTYTLGANVENLTLTGSAALNGTGNALDNELSGNAGNNTLAGGAGNDTYAAYRGMGQDRIVETDATAGNMDVLSFASGIANNQLWFNHTGNDLQISIMGTADKMTVQNWYLGSPYHVELIKTSDNKVLLDTQVEALVQAMAGFTPPAMGQTSLTAAQQTALAPVLAANWH